MGFLLMAMNDDNNVSPMLMPVFAAGVIDTKGYKIGSLYKVKDFYWLLYRSEEDAIDIAISAVTACCTRYWSIPCKASYIPPISLFVLLEQKQEHCKVLSAEGNIGWIHLADWCRDDIEEVKAE